MKALITYLSIDSTSATVFVLVCVVLAAITKCKIHRPGCFIAAMALLMLCFFSPLHVLSAHYLFSAHMTVHVVLLLCVSPLLVLLLPENFGSAFFRFLKQHPIICWLSGVGIMWFWHVPVVFNTTMASMHHRQGFQLIHFAEAISLIVAGVLFSAPVVHSNKDFRIDAMSGVVYLFTACIGCSLLGLLITFAPANTYHLFLSMHNAYGLNKVIQQQGITQVVDQQAAGLIMWVPCCLIYVSGAMYLLMQWFTQKETPVEAQRLVKPTVMK